MSHFQTSPNQHFASLKNQGIPPGFVIIDIARICPMNTPTTRDTLVIPKYRAHIANSSPIVRNVRDPVGF